jgi:adhesin transport system outer membrane protein
VVAAAQDNALFHQQLTASLAEGVDQGSISVADRQQAEERLQSAIVQREEANQDLTEARTALRRLTGLDVNQVAMPANLVSALPLGLEQAISKARTENPLVREAQADVDAANAMVMSSRGALLPQIGVDINGRIGEDIDGFAGETNDVIGRVYLRWNIFSGGIRQAEVQEMVRRSGEARYRLHDRIREAEEDVTNSWTALQTQRTVGTTLERQSQVSDDLLLSYRSQFNIGRRSLLDVLDAQNTRYNVQVQAETASFSARFAEYRLLAATGSLLAYLDLDPPSQSDAYARDLMGTASIEDNGTLPERDVRPVTLNGKLDLSKYTD